MYYSPPLEMRTPLLKWTHCCVSDPRASIMEVRRYVTFPKPADSQTSTNLWKRSMWVIAVGKHKKCRDVVSKRGSLNMYCMRTSSQETTHSTRLFLAQCCLQDIASSLVLEDQKSVPSHYCRDSRTAKSKETRKGWSHKQLSIQSSYRDLFS